MTPPPLPSSSTSPSLASLLNPSSPPPSQSVYSTSPTHYRHQPQSQEHQQHPPNSIHFLTHSASGHRSVLDQHPDPLLLQQTFPNPRPVKRPRLLNDSIDSLHPSSTSSPPTTPNNLIGGLPLPNPGRTNHLNHSSRPLSRPLTSGEVAGNSFMPPPLRAASASAPYPNHNPNTPDTISYRSTANSLASSPTLVAKQLPAPQFPPNPNHRSVSHPLVGSTAPHTHHPASPSRQLHTHSAPPAPASPHSSPQVSVSELPLRRSLTPALSQSGEVNPRASSPPNGTTEHHQLGHVTLPEPDHARPDPFRKTSMALPNHPPPDAGQIPVPVTALEESIFGVGPYDDFAAEVGRFVWKLARPHWLRNEGHLIEVEAKLGILCPRRADAGQRMYFPIGTEAPLLDTDATCFVTNMSANQHKAFNGLLNERVMETNEPGYAGARIKYSHTREVDEFFENRTRVSRCQNTGEVRAVMVKEKLGSMDITCPRRPFDFRISVNLERPAGLPPSDVRPTYRRIKDRLSYAHQICQVDLTQVRTDESSAGLQHELEVEFRESGPLLESADRWADGAGDPTYLTYLQVWLNTVRLLIRNAPEE